jgi:hypothetical protein
MAATETAPVEAFLDELEGLSKGLLTADNRVWEAVLDGSLPLPLLRRLSKEYYFLGRSLTAECANLVALAPDAGASPPRGNPHISRWARTFAEKAGYLGEPGAVGLRAKWAHELGIDDEELDAYVPLPETIGFAFTCAYYMRRSYEEGVAAFGWATARWASTFDYSMTLYEALRNHYGLEVENFRVHAYAESTRGAAAAELLRDVATTADAQRRIRQAVVHVGAYIRVEDDPLRTVHVTP